MQSYRFASRGPKQVAPVKSSRVQRTRPMALPRKADDSDKISLINKVECFIFDCDGRFGAIFAVARMKATLPCIRRHLER